MVETICPSCRDHCSIENGLTHCCSVDVSDPEWHISEAEYYYTVQQEQEQQEAGE